MEDYLGVHYLTEQILTCSMMSKVPCNGKLRCRPYLYFRSFCDIFEIEIFKVDVQLKEIVTERKKRKPKQNTLFYNQNTTFSSECFSR